MVQLSLMPEYSYPSGVKVKFELLLGCLWVSKHAGCCRCELCFNPCEYPAPWLTLAYPSLWRVPQATDPPGPWLTEGDLRKSSRNDWTGPIWNREIGTGEGHE